MGMNRKGSKRLNATTGLSGSYPGVEKETLADVSILSFYIVDAWGNAEMMNGLSVLKVETLIGPLRRVLANVE